MRTSERAPSAAWSRRCRCPSGRRGFTLLEVLVVGGISLIVISAAAAVFASTYRQKQSAERRGQAENAAQAAFTIMQRDLENAGSNFPSSLFSIRIYDAPASLENGDGTQVTGLVAGTDAVEVAIGDPDRSPGLISSVSPGGDADKWVVNLNTRRSPWGDVETGPHVVLFANAAGRSCIGYAETEPVGTQLTVSMRDRDYIQRDRDRYLDGAQNCPSVSAVDGDMSVFMLARRIRYMVRTEGGRTGLFRQESTAANGWFTGSGTLVQEGVEDLQIAPRIRNNIPTPLTDASCLATPSAAATSAYCYCANALSGTCALGAEPNPIVPTNPHARVNGLQVAVIATGEQHYELLNSRPVTVFNRDRSGDAVDHVFRAQLIQTVIVPNLTLVSL